MSNSRTTQISLAVVLAGVALPGILALSAQGAPRSIAVSPVSTPITEAPSVVMPKITRQSRLARRSYCDASSYGPLSYHYPVKPFDRQHPIRGYFGDPRTSTARGAVYAPGARGPFNFHNGVDIEAADGTPVYPVASGKAIVHPDNVVVSSPAGRWFQYYHVVPSVRSGQQVVAYKTVLGHIQAPNRHVHLTEGDGINYHNPLDPGHLEPYSDGTAPTISKVEFRDPQGRRLDPRRLTGTVEITADAHDMPALPVEGNWPGLGVTVPLLEWELRAPDGTSVVPLATIIDFRAREPRNGDFWNVYSAGTRQNKYGSPNLQQVRLIGRYSYGLTPSGLDTRTLANGVYVLTVHAADTCGNAGSLSERIAIAN